PRRAFTVLELEQMVAAGILDEDERIELIGGDVVVLPPKSIDHELLKVALLRYWGPQSPGDLLFAIGTTFRLAEDTYFEPDFVFMADSVGIRGLSATTAKLVVEIADSSLAY